MNLNKKNTILILIIIILLGAFLRFYNLGATTFVADEFLDINSSYAYAKTGVWQNWEFNHDEVNTENVFEARDSRAWIYKVQVAALLKYFSPSESIARSISALWGIVSLVLIYLVTVYFTKKREIGLIAAFLFAVSISGIVFDRRLRMYAMFLPIFLAFSWLTYRFLEEEYKGKVKFFRKIQEKIDVNVIFFLPAVILGVISLMTHQLTGNMVIILIVYAGVQFFNNLKKSKLNKYSLLLGGIFGGFIIGQLMISEKLKSFTAGIQFFNNHWVYFSKVLVDYSNYLLAGLFLILGISYLYKKQSLKKETLWLAVSFFSIIFSAAFLLDRNVGDQYIFFIQSFLIILIAAGIYGAAEFFSTNLSQYGQKAFYIPIILSLLILPNYAYFFQENNTYRQTSESDSPNFRKIFTYFKKAKEPGDVLITRNFRNYYWQGAKVKVYDFGGELAEEKLKLEDIQKIQNENAHGWFIFTDNDEAYIANDAVEYAAKNMEKVSNVNVRGKVKVYRW